MKMTATQFGGGAPSTGLRNRTSDFNSVTKKDWVYSLRQTEAKFVALSNRKDLSNVSAVGGSNLSSKHRSQYSRLVAHRRRTRFPVVANQLSSEFGVGCSEVEEKVILKEMHAPLTADRDEPELSDIPVPEAYSPNVKRELLMLSLPAIVGQAIDPIAMLMETAYIGRLGSVELASAGVSMNIFNYISKLFNIPLLSVATSFVAEDIAKSASKASTIENAYEEITNGKSVPAERKQLSSVSTALLLALGIGMFEALALSLGSGLFLNMMGISSNSPMHIPAKRFLIIRAFGAPAVVASLALQGVFRGFKDTTTPVLCLGIGNLLAAFLLPTLIYYFRLGVTGAAMSTVISQYTVTFLMIWFLNKKAVLLPPKMGSLQFGGYIKSGGFLLGRTLAVLTTMTLGTSMAARQGPVAMAAHQICIQVWLAVSLLTDALATSGQALIASYSSKGEYKIVKEITEFMLKIGLFIGVSLAVILGTSFGSIATLFTKDAAVLEILRSGVLFVSASQPFTSLAYVFDGLHYGVSDFAYAARAMMVVGAISSVFLLYAPSVIGLSGVWLGLTLFMGLRAVAGFVRLLSKSGPWWFLHRDTETSQGLTKRLKKVSETIDQLLEKIIDEHEQVANTRSGKQGHKDFVDVLLSLTNQQLNPNDEQVHFLDRTNVKAILLDMITAAFDTSAASIVWSLAELLRHPRIMKNLQEELQSVVGMDRMVEESDLPKLDYLSMVVKESFRLHPVAPLLIPHESIEDITIDGYDIPKKSRIIVNIWSIGRDPNVWSENVEEFYPERFMNSNIDLRGHDFQLIPFGSGRRGCPGMQLGLTTVRLVLAQLVHCFNWELPNGLVPQDLDMSEDFGLSLSKAKHLLAKPTYRLM